MVDDDNGPDAAYPGPDIKKPDTGEGHGSGLDQAESEPKQGTDKRPEDWNPPPGNPGSDQGAQTNLGKSGATQTDADQRSEKENGSRVDDPDVDPQMNEQGGDGKEPRGVPASDPESGA